LILLGITLGCRGTSPVAPAPTPPIVIARTPPARTCGVEGGQLRGDRVGALRLGMAPDSVKRVCTVVRDTTEMPEGQPGRVLVIAAGGDTLRASLEDGKVYSIVVESPRFRIADSLHVGMLLARVLGLPRLSGGRGEYGLYVWSDEPATCGVSFLVKFAGRDPMIRTVNRASLEPYANSARISQALVRGCNP
jgi:hypothetical protein